MDPQGKLASKVNLIVQPEIEDGKSAATAFDLDVSDRLMKEYVLNLIRFGKVAFPSQPKMDAENTLTLCEDLGLPQAESFCRIVLKKSQQQKQQQQLQQIQNLGGGCAAGYVLVPGNELYSTPTPNARFCVMKYAASNDGNGVAVSEMNKLPWVHILSNEEVIWDMAGNVWHWVLGDLGTGKHAWQEFSSDHFPVLSMAADRLLYAPNGVIKQHQKM